MNNISRTNSIINRVSNVIDTARSKIYHTINHTMLETYWNIGKEIIEEEQQGQERAEYGKEIIDNLSQELTDRYGKGFSSRNLRNMRPFYLLFSNWQTASAKLNWSHYCLLIRINLAGEFS